MSTNLYSVKVGTKKKLLPKPKCMTKSILGGENYVQIKKKLDSHAPITEEMVFRACIVPLLLCGGLKIYSVILLCPIFFGLGLQLGYTVIFGAYASFLFIRTGHVILPIVAHMYCNFMGLPALFSPRSGFVGVAVVMGLLALLYLFFPATSPDLCNTRIDNCSCWHGYSKVQPIQKKNLGRKIEPKII